MRFSWTITFIVVGFLLGAAIPSSAQEKLTVAMLQSPTQTPIWVALESGFFKDYGLEVVPVQFNGGTQTIMALMSGDVQMTTTGGPAAVNAKLNGGSSVIVGTTVGVFPYTFYVGPTIRKPEDLTGSGSVWLALAGLPTALHGSRFSGWASIPSPMLLSCRWVCLFFPITLPPWPVVRFTAPSFSFPRLKNHRDGI